PPGLLIIARNACEARFLSARHRGAHRAHRLDVDDARRRTPAARIRADGGLRGGADAPRQPVLARTARADHRADEGHHPRQAGRGDRGRTDDVMTGPLPTVALVGNPNAGKSSLFNALTGARQKIANYPGVTVERKAGHASFADGRPLALVDLPGSYSLTPSSPDEAAPRDVVHARQA